MATLLLAVILVSGFIFVNLSLSTRYRYKRSEGWDAYFFVAAWGVVFFLAGLLAIILLNLTGAFRGLANIFHLSPKSFDGILFTTDDDAKRIHEIKQIAWVVISIALAAFWGWLMKRRTSRGDRRWDALAKIVGHNYFEALMMEASAKLSPVAITLSSRKVYVGLITCPELEHGQSEHLEMLPLLSGFRDKDELTINITTNYYEHYSENNLIASDGQLMINDFRVVISRDEVETISFFDIDAYGKFKEKEARGKVV